MRITLLALVAALATLPAQAQFDLQVTEIWPGNEPGENLTRDWFEITNFGDTAWTAAVDGDLYYDDDSQGIDGDTNLFDSSIPDILTGVASIAPGESAVFVDEGADAIADFLAVWGSVVDGVQIGLYDGSGLSQGGDGVTLFLSMGAPTSLLDIIDFELYPSADLNGGQSFDVTTGEFSTVAGFAAETAIVNDVMQSAIGSPGFLVPEPSTVAMIAMLAAGLGFARRS
ncbi:MAG: PEP-CTERM sorting domain-containing protein [Planctomycetota bacterium]